jgi:hypothetical protein
MAALQYTPAGELPELDTSLLMYGVLGGATILKLGCYVVCVALQNKSGGCMSGWAQNKSGGRVTGAGGLLHQVASCFIGGSCPAVLTHTQTQSSSLFLHQIGLPLSES